VMMEEDFEVVPSTAVGLDDAFTIITGDGDINIVGGVCLERGTKNVWRQNFAKNGESLRLPQAGATFNINGVDCVPCELVMNWGVFDTKVARSCRWDERLAISGEHIDFFYSHRGTLKPAYLPSLEVLHHKDRTPEYEKLRSRRYWDVFYEKHGCLPPAAANNGRLAVAQKTQCCSKAGQCPPATSSVDTTKPNILVLGVGHSGTTILTRLIEALGWTCTGDEEYAEDVTIRTINQRLRDGKKVGEDEMQAAVEAMPEPWVLKDPRFADNLSKWLPVIRKLRRRPLLIWIRRNTEAVKESFRSRGERSHSVKQLLKDAERNFNDWPWSKIALDYEDLHKACCLWRC